MQNKLVIVGDSAFAEIAHLYFSEDSKYEVVAFAVERAFRNKNELFGLPIVDLEDLQTIFDPDHYSVFVAVTYDKLNRLRNRLMQYCKSAGYRLASYRSSDAFIASNVQIGEHHFIFENNTIQPFVKIGNNAVIWSGNHIGHHSTIGNDCFLSSHVVISGFCEIKDNCFFGVNATVSNNITISDDCWIGPTALVGKNLAAMSVIRNQNSEISKINSHRLFRIQ